MFTHMTDFFEFLSTKRLNCPNLPKVSCSRSETETLWLGGTLNTTFPHASRKIWNASRIVMPFFRRGYVNPYCIVPMLVYVLPEYILHVFIH